MKTRLTRRHFEFIAAVLHDNRPEHDDSLEEIVLWENIVEDFGDRLSDTNDEFSYDKFYEACGYNTNGRHWLAHKLENDKAPARATPGTLKP